MEWRNPNLMIMIDGLFTFVFASKQSLESFCFVFLHIAFAHSLCCNGYSLNYELLH